MPLSVSLIPTQNNTAIIVAAALCRPFIFPSGMGFEWDLQRNCNGVASRVKSEKFEFVPLVMGRTPKGILRIFSARGL